MSEIAEIRNSRLSKYIKFISRAKLCESLHVLLKHPLLCLYRLFSLNKRKQKMGLWITHFNASILYNLLLKHDLTQTLKCYGLTGTVQPFIVNQEI